MDEKTLMQVEAVINAKKVNLTLRGSTRAGQGVRWNSSGSAGVLPSLTS
ncbi:MAG: hypothetical protein IPF48_00010 [Sphingomonadales bacterium]|nr:hypothetical protein [Sphingomonadales bacterium]